MATTPPGEDTEHEEYNEREATEMDSYDGVGSTDQILGPGLPPSANPDARKMGYFNPLKAFWARQVSVTVPHEACRDHFGTCKTLLFTDVANASCVRVPMSDIARSLLLTIMICLSLCYFVSYCWTLSKCFLSKPIVSRSLTLSFHL